MSVDAFKGDWPTTEDGNGVKVVLSSVLSKYDIKDIQ